MGKGKTDKLVIPIIAIILSLSSTANAQSGFTLVPVQYKGSVDTLYFHMPSGSVMFADTIKLPGLSRDSIWHLAFDFMIVNHYLGFWENAFLYSTNEFADDGLYVDTVRALLYYSSTKYTTALPDGKKVKVFARAFIEVFDGYLVVSYRNWNTYEPYQPKGLYTGHPKWKDIPKLPLERRLAKRAEPDNAAVLIFVAKTGKRDLELWTATFRKFTAMDNPPQARKGETGMHPGYPVLARP